MMHDDHISNRIDVDRWLELVETSGTSQLLTELSNYHTADIADLVENLQLDLQIQVLNILDDQSAAEVIAELDPNTQSVLVENLPVHTIATITNQLDSDDAVDMLGGIKSPKADAILRALNNLKRREITDLMRYDAESAGGIMAKEAISVLSTCKVGEAIHSLRAAAETVDDVYNIYVTDEEERILGFLTLKDLVLARSDAVISEIMDKNYIAVEVSMDREKVAAIFQKYDLVSAPVVDDSGRFLGRITHDDILDVIAEEADEDIAYITGQSGITPGETSLIRNLNSRLPWLFLGLLGGIAAATVIAHFESQLSQITSLVFFLPLVAAMGGNAGMQTSSLMVRGLATGEISSYRILFRLMREFSIAILTGTACAGVIFVISWLWQGDLQLAVVVSGALLLVIVFAAIIGAIVPLALNHFGLDPALATGPFVTTTNDIIGLFIYLGIASAVLFV